MFNWKVEDMAIRSTVSRDRYGKLINDTLSAEYSTSREDKIEFVDRMTDGLLTYIMNLSEQFKKDEPTMPKDTWGNVKTISLIAWCKRNDKKYERPIIDTDYRYGKFRLLGSERYIQHADHQGPYDRYADIVDEAFHRILLDCLHKEDEYFKSTDAYEIAKKDLRDYSEKYRTSFGVRLSFWSSGKVCIRDDNDKETRISLDQINFLLNLYRKLDATVAELTDVCTKDFENA